MNRTLAVDCKTVIVTEEEVCPEPTLNLTVDSTDGLTVTVTVAGDPGAGATWANQNPWINWRDGNPTLSAANGTHSHTYTNPGLVVILGSIGEMELIQHLRRMMARIPTHIRIPVRIPYIMLEIIHAAITTKIRRM